MKNRDAFYKKLKDQLDDTSTFPTNYLYKFIVPTDENQEAEVRELFDAGEVSIKTKKSKTGKYISVSIVLEVKDSDEIIMYYRKAEKINGIISL